MQTIASGGHHSPVVPTAVVVASTRPTRHVKVLPADSVNGVDAETTLDDWLFFQQKAAEWNGWAEKS